jgi:Cysteine dioxygenase type I
MTQATLTLPRPEPLGRDLDREELVALALELAGRPEAWRGHLPAPSPGARRYAQLWRDEHVDVWAIAWLLDHDTGYHDHDGSAGAMAVARGRLVEERMVLGGPPLRRVVRRGEAIGFDGAHVHRVTHDGGGAAVSVHAYSPPLVRMGAYVVSSAGELRRECLSYVEELRPLGADR